MLCAVKTIFCHWLDTLWQILCVQGWYAELGSIRSGMQSGCESQAGILLRILPESRHMHDRGHGPLLRGMVTFSNMRCVLFRGHGPLLREWRHFQICAAFHFAGMARSYGNGDIFRYARLLISQQECRSRFNNSDAWEITSVGTTFSRDVSYHGKNAVPTNNMVLFRGKMPLPPIIGL